MPLELKTSLRLGSIFMSIDAQALSPKLFKGTLIVIWRLMSMISMIIRSQKFIKNINTLITYLSLFSQVVKFFRKAFALIFFRVFRGQVKLQYKKAQSLKTEAATQIYCV